MKNTHIIFFIWAVIFSGKVTAQIDYESGSAMYSIPVYGYTDPKSGLSHSVSLSYFSGQGIRVNQLASNTGLGWSIGGGGEIVRVQHGTAPDDQYNPEDIVMNMDDGTASNLIYDQTNSALFTKYFPNGYLYKKFDINYLPKQLAFQPRFGSGEKYRYKIAPKADEDTEEDVFMINLNGSTKSFVIGRNFVAKTTDQSLLRIDIQKEDINDHTLYGQGVVTKITGFIVTDENGIQYTFGKFELEEQQEDQRIGYYDKKQVSNGCFVINRWVLTAVREPVTGRTISFDYFTEHWKYVTDILANGYSGTQTGTGYVTFYAGNASVYKQVLKKISFPNNIEIQFNYTSTTRGDIIAASAISNIEVYSNAQRTRRVDFELGYFSGKNVIDYASVPALTENALMTNSNYIDDRIYNAYVYRLMLKAVHIRSGDLSDEQVYSFDYYTGAESSDAMDRVPSRLDSHRDYSGLYNKSMDIKQLGTQAGYKGYHYDSNPEAAIGCLKTISTPLGASLRFEYKSYPLTVRYRNAVLVHRITTSDPVSSQTYIKGYNYDINADLLPFQEDPANTYAVGVSAVHTNIYAGRTDGDFGKRTSYNVAYNRGDKKLVGDYLFYSSPSEVYSKLSSITSTSISTFLNPVYGFLSTFGFNILGSLFNDLFGSQVSNYTFYTLSDRLQSDANALPTSLSYVKEYDYVNNAYHLSSVYKFSNTYETDGNQGFPADVYPIRQLTPPFSAKQRVDPGLLGNLSSIQMYNWDGSMVYQKNHSYGYKKTVLDDNYKSVKYGTGNYYSDGYSASPPYLTGTIPDSWIISDAYNYITGRPYLSQQTEQTYNLSGTQSARVSNFYTYNNKNNQISQSYAINSDGRYMGVNTFYAVDFWDSYQGNAILQGMKASNLTKSPVAVVTWYKPDQTISDYYVTAVAVLEYDPASFKLARRKVYRIPQVIIISQAQMDAFDPFNLPSWLSSGYKTDTEDERVYDDNIVIESWRHNGTSVQSFIYDPNSWQPSAMITNATSGQVAYSSFENSNQGGWTYNSAGVAGDGTAVTGKYFFNLSNNNSITKQGLNTALFYQVTLWARSGDVSVNGQSGVELYSGNGWKLLQFNIGQVSSVSVTGNTQIDELRLMPVDARMTTTVYDPVLRTKIAECDANNRLMYYEYDSWGRLNLIRDENMNVIKTNEYNIKK